MNNRIELYIEPEEIECYDCKKEISSTEAKYYDDDDYVYICGDCAMTKAELEYTFERGERFINGSKERERQFILEHLLGTERWIAVNGSMVRRMTKDDEENYVKSVKLNIEMLRAGFIDKISIAYIGTWAKYMREVKDFCLGLEGIEEYTKAYMSGELSKPASGDTVDGGLYEWIDTNSTMKAAV